MALPGPAVAPWRQEREDVRAYLLPRCSKKAKTRGVPDRKFSQNRSIPQRRDSKVRGLEYAYEPPISTRWFRGVLRAAVQQASIPKLVRCEKIAGRRHTPHSR